MINDNSFDATGNIYKVPYRIKRLKFRLGEVNIKINRCRWYLVCTFFTRKSERQENQKNFFFQDVKLF